MWFLDRSEKNKMTTLASDWLRHFWLLLWNRQTKLDRKQDLNVLCEVNIFRADLKSNGLWLAGTISTSLKLLNGIERDLTGSKISIKISTKFVLFGPIGNPRWPIGKTRWPPWPQIGWVIFNFFSEPAEQISTKLDKKQVLDLLYQVCVFRASLKYKMAALASNWLRHFQLTLWNHWMELNENWQEAIPQHPLHRKMCNMRNTCVFWNAC